MQRRLDGLLYGTTLFAAPDVASGKGIGQMHYVRRAEFLLFSRTTEEAVPCMHFVVNDYGTHETPRPKPKLATRAFTYIPRASNGFACSG